MQSFQMLARELVVVWCRQDSVLQKRLSSSLLLPPSSLLSPLSSQPAKVVRERQPFPPFLPA